MRFKVETEEAQERRGLDYASCVYVSATERHQREVFDFCCALAEEIESAWDWAESGRSAHFSRCFTHPVGARIELTELDGGAGRNPGMTLLHLPGACFYLQSTAQQMLMLWKAVTQDGFKWFSRIDFQNTELQPEWDMERVHQGVVDGLLWVKGHRSYEPRGELAPDGSCPEGRTLYWGSPRSERRGRTYDKSKESDWLIPAIRDEVQLRGEWAHTYGRELAAALRGPGGSDAMATAVDQLTVKALNQHLQYWELNGADPATDKNWTRKAKPADWYAERIGRASEPLRKAPRMVLDLESTTSWGIRQYGRTFATWVEHHVNRTGLSREFIAYALYLRFFARLAPEDLVALDIAVNEDEMVEANQFLQGLRDDQSIADEHGWWAGG
jgi:hypothetical protein